MKKKNLVLIVEDNEMDMMMIKQDFKSSTNPISIVEAYDGAAAIDYLVAHQHDIKKLPNLILLDINLPKRNGWEVIDFIKMNEQLKHIPVVIFTTSSAEGDVLRAYKRQVSCYLVKPFELDEYTEIMKATSHLLIEKAVLPG